jgi:hypothetical protein
MGARNFNSGLSGGAGAGFGGNEEWRLSIVFSVGEAGGEAGRNLADELQYRRLQGDGTRLREKGRIKIMAKAKPVKGKKLGTVKPLMAKPILEVKSLRLGR